MIWGKVTGKLGTAGAAKPDQFISGKLAGRQLYAVVGSLLRSDW
jgi:hypothetical protein